jgi:hypothetical protein
MYCKGLLHRLPHWFAGYQSIGDQVNGAGHHSEPVPVESAPKSMQFAHGLWSVILSSWINALAIFVPIGFAAWMIALPPVVIFITNAVAIVPLSALLTEATERIANEAGDSIGALLNISLGNLVELIILYVTCRNPILKAYWTDHLAVCELPV